jgi:hypothetical protein
VERDVLRLLFGEPVAEIPTGDARLSTAQLARYEGTYRLASGVEFVIRTSGRGLEIPAADPEVATAFVSMPPLDAAHRERLAGIDSVTARIVRGIMTGEFGPFREHFRPVPALDVESEVRFWTGWSRSSTTRFGEFRGSRVVGTVVGETRGIQALQTYVAVRFARGARMIRFVQPAEGPDRRFFIETVSPTALPGRHVLVPRSTTEFVTYSFAFRQPTLVTFAADGDRVLGLAVLGGGRADKVR